MKSLFLLLFAALINTAAQAARQAPSQTAPQARLMPGVSSPVKTTPRVAPKPAPIPANARTVPPTPQFSQMFNPNTNQFPRSSLHDFSGLVEAPAGRRGFVSTRGDHFYWADGSRARFWGINVANTSLQASEREIDAMIENFRRAGFNLLRLHHFDERGGIIDLEKDNSREFVPARLKKLDYWIYKAKQAGIYIYLDLLDYRRFKEGDGVVNAEAIGRAARPYAVFDARLIELQKEYARKLMRDHVNPYTGLAYADDPAIVMLEIYDESGLFMRRGVWRTMPEPYATHFKKLWNDLLQAKYKDTSTLINAWNMALQPGENLEAGTIELPAMTWTPNQLPPDQRVFAAASRRNEGALFAYDVHVRYFREMKSYLRGIGVKIPVCVTGRFEDLADLKSMSAELDFIGSNFYYDHPYWGTGLPAWKPPSYFHNLHPLRHVDEKSFAANVSLGRIKGKPYVIREWNYCWPNRNRGAGILEAAAYAALHDIDALILFVYETVPSPRVSYFNVRSDPTRWGLVGIGAQIYLKGLVRPARNRVVIPYNNVDVFSYDRYDQMLYALGWTTRVENDFYDGKTYQAPDDVTLIVPPGRSASGEYSGAPAVLYTRSLVRDLAGRTVFAPDYLARYGLTLSPIDTALHYDGLLYDAGVVRARRDLALPLSLVQGMGHRAIGIGASADAVGGFVDAQNKRLVFGSLTSTEAMRAAIEAMRLFNGAPNLRPQVARGVYVSDTQELKRDAMKATLAIETPQVAMLAGNWGASGTARVLRAQNLRGGTLVALSLDGRALEQSRRFVVKMVTDARNVDEVVGRDPRFVRSPKGQWQATVLGRGPVTTQGRISPMPLRVSLGKKQLLDVYLSGGSWELLVDGNTKKFYCDTPGARYVLH
jgi:hypothetical protein